MSSVIEALANFFKPVSNAMSQIINNVEHITENGQSVVFPNSQNLANANESPYPTSPVANTRFGPVLGYSSFSNSRTSRYVVNAVDNYGISAFDGHHSIIKTPSGTTEGRISGVTGLSTDVSTKISSGGPHQMSISDGDPTSPYQDISSRFQNIAKTVEQAFGSIGQLTTSTASPTASLTTSSEQAITYVRLNVVRNAFYYVYTRKALVKAIATQVSQDNKPLSVQTPWGQISVGSQNQQPSGSVKWSPISPYMVNHLFVDYHSIEALLNQADALRKSNAFEDVQRSAFADTPTSMLTQSNIPQQNSNGQYIPQATYGQGNYCITVVNKASVGVGIDVWAGGYGQPGSQYVWNGFIGSPYDMATDPKHPSVMQFCSNQPVFTVLIQPPLLGKAISETVSAGQQLVIDNNMLTSNGYKTFGQVCIANQSDVSILGSFRTYNGLLGSSHYVIPPGTTKCIAAYGATELNFWVEAPNGGWYSYVGQVLNGHYKVVVPQNGQMYVWIVTQDMVNKVVPNAQNVQNIPSWDDLNQSVYGSFYDAYDVNKLPNNYIQVNGQLQIGQGVAFGDPYALGVVTGTTYVYPSGQTVTETSNGVTITLQVKPHSMYTYSFNGGTYVKYAKNSDIMDPFMFGLARWAFRRRGSGAIPILQAPVPYDANGNIIRWKYTTIAEGSKIVMRDIKEVSVIGEGVVMIKTSTGKTFIVHGTPWSSIGETEYFNTPMPAMNHFWTLPLYNQFGYYVPSFTEYGYDGNNLAVSTVYMGAHYPRFIDFYQSSTGAELTASGLLLALGYLASVRR